MAKEGKGEQTTKPNWLLLPRDLIANILHRLGPVEILTSARKVCLLWWNICKDPLMWRTIDRIKAVDYDLDSLARICCHAVDLSCGHLEEIVILDFGNDYLLQYIAHRASHLRRLKIFNSRGSAHRFCCKGFNEALKKLSLLEELDISISNLSINSLEVIGQCCSLLQSLKLYHFVLEVDKSNEVAFTIAKTMPRLRYLMIAGIMLTDVALLAILDGCSLLESLHLHLSSNVDLSERVVKRCHHQIEDLKLPIHKLSIS